MPSGLNGFGPPMLLTLYPAEVLRGQQVMLHTREGDPVGALALAWLSLILPTDGENLWDQPKGKRKLSLSLSHLLYLCLSNK